MVSDLEGQVKVPAILNPAGMDLEDWERLRISPEFAEKQKEIVQAYKNSGFAANVPALPILLKDFQLAMGTALHGVSPQPFLMQTP